MKKQTTISNICSRKFNLILSTFALLMLAHLSLFAQTTNFDKEELLKEWDKLDKFTQFVHTKQPDFSFYAALVVNGKIVSEKRNGYADRKRKVKLSRKTIHKWGSVSKLFMVVSMLQLVEKGKISLYDPIIKYLPELGKGIDSLGGMQAVKIYHLLNHTGGLSTRKGYFKIRNIVRDKMKAQGLPFRFATIKEYIPYLKYTEQKRKPGVKYQYDNGGYNLIGIILERVANMGFREYVKQNILDKLKMKNTFYGVLPKRKFKHLETLYGLYQDKKTGKVRARGVKFNISQGMSGPNGGVKATSEDMVKFMNLFRFRNYRPIKYRYEKVLKQETLNKYLFNVDTKIKDETKFSSGDANEKVERYKILGLTMRKTKPGNHIVYGHSGQIGFAESNFLFNKERPFGILLMVTMGSKKKDIPYKLSTVLFRLTRLFASEGDFGDILEKLDTNIQK